MSQTITAVALASQSTFWWRTAQSPAASRIRLRELSVNVPAVAVAINRSKEITAARFMAVLRGMLPAWSSVVNENRLQFKRDFAKLDLRFSLAK